MYKQKNGTLYSLVAQTVKNLLSMQEVRVQSLGWEDPLKKGKGTHSSILAWRIPRMHSSWGCKESDTNESLSLSQIWIMSQNEDILISKEICK